MFVPFVQKYPLLIWILLSGSAHSLQIISKDEGVLPMGQTHEMSFKVLLDHQEISEWQSGRTVQLDFNLTNERSWAVELLNETLEFTLEDVQWSLEKSIYLEAIVIGVDALNVTPKIMGMDGEMVWTNVSTSFPISAVLADRTLNDIFTVIMISMIIVNTVNMGEFEFTSEDYTLEILNSRGPIGFTNYQRSFQAAYRAHRGICLSICHHAFGNSKRARFEMSTLKFPNSL